MSEDTRRPDGVPRSAASDRPAVAIGPGLVRLVTVVTAATVGASWLAPLLPVARGDGWRLAQKGLGVDGARTLPSWWVVVLFAVTALGCHAQGLTTWRRRGAPRAVAVSWWVLALGMLWVSFDHALAIHESAPSLAAGLLPGPLGLRPVETVLVLVVGPAGVVVLAAGTWTQRVLLPLAGALYLTGQVVVGGGLVDVGLSPHRTSVVEVALQMAGAVAVLAAASSTPRVAAPPGATTSSVTSRAWS